MVCRLKPGKMQRTTLRMGFEAVVLHTAKAQQRFHVVLVQLHRLRHALGFCHVGIEQIMAQRGLMRQPPEQPVQQIETARIAVLDDAFAKSQKFRRYVDRRCRLSAGSKVRGFAGRWRCLAQAIAAMPAHLPGRDVLRQQAPRGVPEARQIDRTKQRDGQRAGQV